MRREGVMRGGSTGRPDRLRAAGVRRPRVASPAGSGRCSTPSCPASGRSASCWCATPTTGCCCASSPTSSDWDLPGGVVEVGESPQLRGRPRGRARSSGSTCAPGTLLLTDWLPPWGGWDDAALPGLRRRRPRRRRSLDAMVRQQREIRSAEFCTPSRCAERCADFTARRVAAALAQRRRRRAGVRRERPALPTPELTRAGSLANPAADAPRSHHGLRVRLRRGQQGPAGPARRQGRQPRRDDQPRAARATGLHDHHRGLPRLPAARR